MAKEATATRQGVEVMLGVHYRGRGRVVVFLGAAPELAGETGWYVHQLRRKAPPPLATDPDNGRRLWERGEPTLAGWLGA